MKKVKFILLPLFICLLFTIARAEAGLIAYYPFEDFARDATGHGYDGTPHNDPLYFDQGYSGKAYWFDGRDDYIELPLTFDPQNPPSLTIGGWVNFGYIPYQGTSSIPSQATWSVLTNNGPTPTAHVTLNKWTFIAASYDSQTKTVNFYVDGQMFAIPGIINLGTGPLRIGSFPGLDTYFFGTMDDVFIYDEALSKEELDAIMTYGITPIPVPSSLLLMASGVLGLVGYGGRKGRLTRL